MTGTPNGGQSWGGILLIAFTPFRARYRVHYPFCVETGIVYFGSWDKNIILIQCVPITQYRNAPADAPPVPPKVVLPSDISIQQAKKDAAKQTGS